MNNSNGKVIITLPKTSQASQPQTKKLEQPTLQALDVKSKDALSEFGRSTSEGNPQITPSEFGRSTSEGNPQITPSELAVLEPEFVDKYGGEIDPIEEWDVIRRNALDAIASDPHQLARAILSNHAQSDTTITSDELAKIIDIPPKRTREVWDEFRFIRCSYIKIKQGDCGASRRHRIKKVPTWKVERFNPIREREQRKLGKASRKNNLLFKNKK